MDFELLELSNFESAMNAVTWLIAPPELEIYCQRALEADPGTGSAMPSECCPVKKFDAAVLLQRIQNDSEEAALVAEAYMALSTKAVPDDRYFAGTSILKHDHYIYPDAYNIDNRHYLKGSKGSMRGGLVFWL